MFAQRKTAELALINGINVDDQECVSWDAATGKTRRARRADMSRADFITVVAGWSSGLVLVLFISAMARYVN
jgi:hypothetical protein